jgi:ABC-type branched-subunit amino acid transport system substrate-binding protein
MVPAVVRRLPRGLAPWHRFLAAALVVAACAGAGAGPRAAACRSPLAAAHVEPEFRADWERVLAAQAKDPGGVEVSVAADALLARGPPPEVRMAALHAKAQVAWLAGDDGAALRWLDEALALGGVREALEHAAQRLRTFALARGGPVDEALVAVEDAERRGLVDPQEAAGARAVALDRSGRADQAALAFARWRARVDGAAPEAAYAERRFSVLAAGLSAEQLEQLAARVDEPAAAACLRVRAGVRAAAEGQPSWIEACRPEPRRVGILLPRTGPLAALADEQLAAAVAAVRVLSAEDPQVQVAWRDAGSTADSARAGAADLSRASVDTIVGPVGAPAVGAAADAAAGIPLVLPGEGGGPGVGVAPTLEARLRAALDHARGAGARDLVILAPANRYGDRAVAAVHRALEEIGWKGAKTQRYEASTTSFSSVLEPVRRVIGAAGTAVLVADSIGRTELAVRQLRRDGLDLRRRVVLATAEGLDAAALGPGHEALEGLLTVPPAVPEPADAPFVAEHERLTGQDPGPQGLLVFRALRHAWRPGSPPAPRARVARVEGGRLVAVAPPG